VKTGEFDYDLPKRLIAQRPVEPRDSARLLVLRRDTKTIEHRIFRDLVLFLNPGDLFVLNDTRVIPARLFAHGGTDGAVSILLIREIECRAKQRFALQASRWEALIDGHGHIREGEVLLLVPPDRSSPGELPHANPLPGSDFAPSVRLLRRGHEGKWVIELLHVGLTDILTRFGAAPLPPYVRRDFGGGVERSYDLARYQTTFARHDGSIAAPTAGLHFTPELLARMTAAGAILSYVTLHVGIGTFKPVRASRLEDHKMESERYEMPVETAEAVNSALPNEGTTVGCRIVAVGTTVCRTLEHAAASAEFATTGRLKAGPGVADLFIHPPFTFRVVNALLTNFHLPRGTPLMLTCAFAGRELVLHAYEVAKKEGYRFYSYGDAMLIV
jgi:S-adenosylmethionine:tRNA ribosyltransferase-isomerase